MPIPAVVLPSAPVLCWIVPPLPAEPVPLTISEPVAPVVSRLIPTPAVPAPVPALMLWNLRSATPMVVLATLSAVPDVVVMVLVVAVDDTVPPPVALKPVFAAVERVNTPVKLIVDPVLVVRSTPLPPVEALIVPA